MLKILIAYLSAALCFSTPAWALESPIPTRGLAIRQERVSANGVLVSRPSATDLMLAELIRKNRITTVQEYTLWLSENTSYEQEKGSDQWLTPEEFLAIRAGDCEDFAILNQHVLRVLGFKSHVLTLHTAQRAHAICAFEYNGRLYWLDNQKLKSSSARSLAALAQEIAEEFNYSRSFKLDPLSRSRTLIYQRG